MVAHSPDSICSIALPSNCSTPSTSGKATIKVVESSLEEEREDVDDDADDDKETAWQDSLARMKEMHNMYGGKLTDNKMDDFGLKNGSLEEGMEEVDLNQSATEDKVAENERENGNGKPKRAGVWPFRQIYDCDWIQL